MRQPWSQIKLIALVMLLTVITHDAVMAGDPHSAPHPSHQPRHTAIAPHGDHVGQAGWHGDEVTTNPGHDGASGHAHGPSPCGLMVAARPVQAADSLPEPAAGGAAPLPTTDHVVLAHPGRASDPGPSPPARVRRALLQVFLN